MNSLADEKRCAAIRCSADGRSARPTTRIAGVAKNTIQKVTGDRGKAVLDRRFA